MSLNNYKLKNILISKIGVSPIYKNVIDSDEIDNYKRKHEITELEIFNFLSPVSVLQQNDTYVLISGVSTFMAFRDSGASNIKARILTTASPHEKMLCVLHDIMSVIRLLPHSAKKRNHLKDRLYSFINNNQDAVKAFSLINSELSSFSKILTYYDKPYRSAHFEHKKKNGNHDLFKLKGKWFGLADAICFDFNDGKLVGLYAVKNGFNQKIIFEQRPDSTYEAKASYATNQALFRFRIIPDAVFLANIDSSLICFQPIGAYSEEISIGNNGVNFIKLAVIKKDERHYFLTANKKMRYLINGDGSKYTIRRQDSNTTCDMRKYQLAVLPAE